MGAEQDAVNLDEFRKKKKEAPPSDGDPDTRPVIRILAGALPTIVDQAEVALVASQDGLYKQGQRLVRVIWDKIKTAGGGEGDILRLSQVVAAHLVERFTAAAHFEKWDGRSNSWVTCNCPPQVAEVYLARDGVWSMPFILGVVTTPTLRPDGTILDQPGYDPATGILFNPLGVAFPTIPANPTKADAIDALNFLKKPLEHFPFARAPDRSVALSGIITTVVRRSLPTAPLHAFSAPTAGAGKSMLVDMASIIATGERAAVTSTGKSRDGDVELEKRLTASMLGGDIILSIDNLEAPLGGELLCQLLTQTSVKLRALGRSVNIDVPVTTSFFATGNNLTVVGDLTRRVLMSVLNVADERPELRHFSFNPLEMAKRHRGEYVKAVLVILRAYIIAEEKMSVTPFGSFEEWSRMVREPLIWLDEADPVDVIEEVRRGDPKLQRLKTMMEAWKVAFAGAPQRVRDVVHMAQSTDEEGGGSLLYPDLQEALIGIMGGDTRINAEKVSWWLRKNARRAVGGMCFERDDGDAALPKWRLVAARLGEEDTP